MGSLNGNIQAIPLCSRMVNVLRGYMATRGGEEAGYLFCDEYGEMLTENALRLAITHYNRRRGVQKTSIHPFRHTFARKYLVDCGGDAFTLQKIPGHSTLKMTKHYCAIYDADIARNYDRIKPSPKYLTGLQHWLPLNSQCCFSCPVNSNVSPVFS